MYFRNLQHLEIAQFSMSPNAWFILLLVITMGTFDATMIECEVTVEGCFCYVQITT